MPFSFPSMTNPFMGLPLGKGVLKRAEEIHAANRPGAFTPYQPRTIPSVSRAPAAALPAAAPANPSAALDNSGGLTEIQQLGISLGGLTPEQATVMRQEMLAPHGVTVTPPPEGITQTQWNNILPGAQGVAAQGQPLPAYMFGLNPVDHPGGMLTSSQAAAILNPPPTAPTQSSAGSPFPPITGFNPATGAYDLVMTYDPATQSYWPPSGPPPPNPFMFTGSSYTGSSDNPSSAGTPGSSGGTFGD